MEPSVAAIVAATAANAVVLLGGFGLWLAYRTRRAERLEQRERERAQLYLGPIEARLAELARGVDAIAVEVERVAETQRYLVARGQPPGRAPTACCPADRDAALTAPAAERPVEAVSPTKRRDSSRAARVRRRNGRPEHALLALGNGPAAQPSALAA